MRTAIAIGLCLSACTADPTAVQVELAPSLISSIDGTTAVSALVSADTTPLADTVVRMSVTYQDRNGTAHALNDVDGRTDDRGVFHATLEGLLFDGIGTVVIDTGSITGDATFVVLDRTPPKVEILPPTTDGKVGPGLPIDVQVRVTDEIGVANVTLDGISLQARSTVISTGAAETTLTFRTSVSANAQNNSTIELHALATDLSGNIGVAAAVTLTVDAAITIATPPGLSGSLLVDGTATQIASPKSIVVSAMDGKLYVADAAQSGACVPSCIWKVDATTGVVDPTPVVVGTGSIEGLALDADSSNLFFTDRADRTGRLTWNGTAYANPVACSNPAQQQPQTPFHLVVDPTLGLLVADDNAQDVIRVAACAAGSVGTTFSTNGNFDQIRGIALGAAGEIYVSDQNRDTISQVDRNTGAITQFSTAFQAPYGLEWLGTGTSAWANALMVAGSGDRVVGAVTSTGELAAAFVRNPPIDLAFSGGSMFVLTVPANGIRGRIYKVTGF